MCQFIESIKVENRLFHNLKFHQKRLNNVFDLYFKNYNPIVLSKITIPEYVDNKLYKCRILYNSNIINIEFQEYTFKTINSLKIIEDNNIDYSSKFADRSQLNLLTNQKGIYDDIIIIKNGYVTDSSFCNIAFLKNKKWYTPKSFLLPGTMRAYLLLTQQVEEIEIKKEDIFSFEKAKLINCFNDLDNGQEILINNIYE